MGDPNVGVARQRVCDSLGKRNTVHGQCAAGGNSMRLGAPQDQTVQAAKLLLQKSHGVGKRVAPEGIGAYQLSEQIGSVGRGHLVRLHLHQFHGKPELRQLPGRFTAGQARADHRYRRGHALPPAVFPLPDDFFPAFFPEVFPVPDALLSSPEGSEVFFFR